MKKQIFKLIISQIIFIGSVANAVEYETDLMGEATECYKYSTWTGTCNGEDCKYPDDQKAIYKILEQTKPDEYFYGCDQLSPYEFRNFEKISSNGNEICLTTQASARFHCRASW